MAKTPRKRTRLLGYTEAASLGIEMAVAIAIGGLGGYYLEANVTHWSPWTSLIGLALGVGAAANAIVRAARDLKAGYATDPSSPPPQRAEAAKDDNKNDNP